MVYAASFAVGDKSEVPEYLKKALTLFYQEMPDLSLLDPDVSMKLDAPRNKDMPLYAHREAD